MSKQAMEMALEALEELEYSITASIMRYPSPKAVDRAIEALKEAIKQQGEENENLGTFPTNYSMIGEQP